MTKTNDSSPHRVKDPVCGMTGPKKKFPQRYPGQGKTYYFCSTQCLNLFKAVPRGYVGEGIGDVKHVETHQEAPDAAKVPGMPHSVITYTCPMHPEVRQDRPGMCPECGMALVPAASHQTPDAHKTHVADGSAEVHDRHAGHSTQAFYRKFWVSLLLTIPVVLDSELPEKLFGWIAPSFQGSEYLSLLLSSMVFYYGGWVFLASAWREIKGRLPGMMTLISMAITAAFLYSVANTLLGREHTLFWELTTLITIMLLGHWIEMRAVQSAQGALRELSKLLPDKAEKVKMKQEKVKTPETEIVPVSALAIGDLVLVRPGGRIPADGVVVSGESDVNESMITGESRPRDKSPASEVIAGTINGSGSLMVKVTKVGENTFLSGVMRLVADAQASKSRLQLLSDKAAFYLTIVAVAVGSVALVAWLVVADAGVAIERFVAVLVIACPHALGLAVPLVASISTTLAARSGLLVRQRLALEAARNIDMVLFDKTGTLTTGQYGVTKIWPIGATAADEVLGLAAAVDAHSEHFIAKAIVAGAKNKKLKIDNVESFKALAGKGVVGKVGQTEVMVGGTALLAETHAKLAADISSQISREAASGKTIIYVFRQRELIGAMALADLIREESRQAITELKRIGVKIAMITGDAEDVAQWVTKELGIDEYFAHVLPDQKAQKVKLLQQRGLKVAMVGDGINDAPALTQADLGIAIGAGTNVAIESAGIILVRSDPRDIVKIIKLSRLTYRKMIENLFWAAGYNIVAMPLAAGVLANQGVILQPAAAAILMSASTVIVAINAVALRRTRL